MTLSISETMSSKVLIDKLHENPANTEALYALLSLIPTQTLEIIKNGPDSDIFIKYLELKMNAETQFDDIKFWERVIEFREKEVEYCEVCPTIGHGNDSCHDHDKQQTLFFTFEMPEFNEDGTLKKMVTIGRKFSTNNCHQIIKFLHSMKSKTFQTQNDFLILILTIKDYYM